VVVAIYGSHCVGRGGIRPNLVPFFFLIIRYKGQNNNKIIANNKNIMINEVHENLFYWIVGLVFWICFQMFL
jgi:hypothetical protein